MTNYCDEDGPVDDTSSSDKVIKHCELPKLGFKLVAQDFQCEAESWAYSLADAKSGISFIIQEMRKLMKKKE